MARESPPTRRVTEVLDAFVSQPGRVLRLADVAERTGISKATALGILNELCSAGYLARDPGEKTYRPGPGMLAVGAAAQAGYAAVELAKPAMARLAARFHSPCTASALVDGRAAALARIGGSDRLAPAIRVGLQYPVAPPSGVMFFAWSPDAAVEGWLASPAMPGTVLRPDELRRAIALCRERGYLVERMDELSAGLLSLLSDVADPAVSARLSELIRRTQDTASGMHTLIGELTAGAVFDVSHVCAPVFGRDGRMEFLLAMLVMATAMPAADVLARIEGVVQTAAELTTALGGQDPWRSS